MADRVLSYGELKTGQVRLKLKDEGGKFSIPTVDKGSGPGVSVLLSEILDGTYKLVFVDNHDGTYSPASGTPT